MSRIIVTGDIHGKAAKRFAAMSEYIDQDDVVVLCGDFGIPFGIANPHRDESWAERERAEAGWLNSQGWLTVVPLGNHDDRCAVKDMPIRLNHGEGITGYGRVLSFDGRTYDNIVLVDAPCLWKIGDKTCLMIPGASSHDVDPKEGYGIIDPAECGSSDEELEAAAAAERERCKWRYGIHTIRIKDWTWWEDEDVDIEELQDLIETHDLFNTHIDYIFSHEAPTQTLLDAPCGFYGMWRDRHLGTTTAEQDYLCELYDKLDFDHWFTGHYHRDTTWTDNISTVYYDIIVADEDRKGTVSDWKSDLVYPRVSMWNNLYSLFIQKGTTVKLYQFLQAADLRQSDRWNDYDRIKMVYVEGDDVEEIPPTLRAILVFADCEVIDISWTEDGIDVIVAKDNEMKPSIDLLRYKKYLCE